MPRLLVLLLLVALPAAATDVGPLLQPDCFGPKYAVARDLFLKERDVRQAIEAHIERTRHARERRLCQVLLFRLDNREACEQVAAALAERSQTAAARTQRVAQTRSGHEVAPDPMLDEWHVGAAGEVARRLDALRRQYARHHEELTAETLAAATKEYEARNWDRDMPGLRWALTEIALKGFRDDALVAKLKAEGWGDDFPRQMAIDLVGQFADKEDVPWLLELLQDDKDGIFARAHTMRALCAIRDPTTLGLLLRIGLDAATPKEIRQEAAVHRFPPEALFDEYAKLLRGDAPPALKQAVLSMLPPSPALRPRAVPLLEELAAAAKDEHLRLAYRQRLLLWKTRDRGVPAELSGDLQENWAVGIDLEGAAERLWEGKASAEETRQVTAKYISVVDQVAASYRERNCVATPELHLDGWPENVADTAARELLITCKGMRPGLAMIEVWKRLGLAPLKRIDDDPYEDTNQVGYRPFGDRIVRWVYEREFPQPVIGPYGKSTKKLEVVFVFVDGKLTLVHVPQR